MTDQFAFLENKRKAAIAVAMSLGVLLLLLPASLGYGGTVIIQEAFGQFNLPLLEDEEAVEEENGGIVVEEEEEDETTTTTTTPTTPTSPPPTAADDTTTTNAALQDLSTYMMAERNDDSVRGFIGSSLYPTQGAGGGNTLAPADDSGHILTGVFRLFANDSHLERFVAEIEVAAIDGSSFHDITIEEGAPRFEVTEGTGTSASSNIVGNIYLNGGTTPAIVSVPMTISIRGQVLAIEGIDIDETRITDTGQQDILSIIDGQSIFGTIPRG